jgi:menaquinone-specific isochorismate synthase
VNLLRANHIQEKLQLHILDGHEAPYFSSFEIFSSIDALEWLKENKQQPTVYWRARDNTLELAGIGLAEAHYDSVQEAQNRLDSLPHPLRAFGGCSFSKESDGWGHFGQARFWIPRILYIRKGTQYFIQHCVLSNDSIPHTEPPNFVDIPKHIPSKSQWFKQIERAYDGFSNQELKKVVFARQTHIDVPLNPLDALRTIRAQQSQSFDFAFSPFGNRYFIGCSPELLLSVKNRTLHTEALAGTRPKGTSPEELLQSEKERREHRFVFAHILDRIKPHCTDINHAAQPIISTHNHVIHLKTAIEGTLKKETNVQDLIQALHPTPAVCGLPQEQSMKLIEEYEGFDRGWYAGPVGWISKEEAELAVGIRSALFQNNSCLVWAGAGIIEGSHAQQEWQEIEDKSRQFLLLSQTKQQS